jgi:hypothetical protein
MTARNGGYVTGRSGNVRRRGINRAHFFVTKGSGSPHLQTTYRYQFLFGALPDIGTFGR